MTPDLLAFMLIVTVMVCATIVVCVCQSAKNAVNRDETLEELTRTVSDLAAMAFNASMIREDDQVERMRIENNPDKDQRKPQIQFPSAMDRMVRESNQQEIPRMQE
ncbi:MAG: hypothetical protein JKY67_00365 [Pseudomonadales bacterium]|nr:hypothetical protein [Pseudomonadales bacterium]MBL4864812.1 hypothetical protein [Pseudomonadales bacterium]